jgi:hypothetical protein
MPTSRRNWPETAATERRPLLVAAELALDPVLPHDAGDLVATGFYASPAQLQPGLAGAGVPSAAGADSLLGQELAIVQLEAGRLPGSARVVRAHRHAQRAADRLDLACELFSPGTASGGVHLTGLRPVRRTLSRLA